MCFRICMLKLRRLRTYPTNKREAPAEPSHSRNNVYVSLQPRLKSPLSTFDFTPPSTQLDIMADALAQHEGFPGGVFSLLDTDLYKLTMQCAILKYLPDVPVTYKFTNRTPQKKLNRAAFQWLELQISKLGNIFVTPEEIQYLKTTCSFLNGHYLHFLSEFRLSPSNQVQASFQPSHDTGSEDDEGDFSLKVVGNWLDTILYETPLLALTSEAYFRFCDTDWDYNGQEGRAYNKGIKLMENGCIFSEFGTRRRRSYHTQDLVLRGLTRAADTAAANMWAGKLSGSSNVHFAMKYGIPPVGTVAHEWFMGIASIKNDYEHANETALRYWVGCFGEGVLGIALTDTFGTPSFLKAFGSIMPTPEKAREDAIATRIPGAPQPCVPLQNGYSNHVKDMIESTNSNGIVIPGEGKSFAQIFAGVRQDSGDPRAFIKMMRDFYDSQGITEKKTIVFSDSLNIERCIEYMHAAKEAGFLPTFGVGTFLSNDFTHISNGKKSSPLNIVIKLSSANGSPAIKISDNVGKNSGDSETVDKVKASLGYIERTWANGDETTRWGPRMARQ